MYISKYYFFIHEVDVSEDYIENGENEKPTLFS